MTQTNIAGAQNLFTDDKYSKISGRSNCYGLNSICFRGLDGYYRYPEVKDKDTLRKTLMEVAATEGAMKYSFYDLRDIILGYDNLEDKSTRTEKNMKEIFKSESNEGSQGRQTFWNNNKDCVWEAMKCGYNKSGETIPDECKNMPSDSDYPIGSNRDEGTAYQFLRWFAEWGEDFCKT
ncbi:erythrocyte membrane protein 1 (PfEMP1), putative [Plasmodium sp.]|nr:erythrocyte membrane protein 1 (PfEMP1), putative [Plasmodium sp.]